MALLPNGEMIKNDVITCFHEAVDKDENQKENGTIDWDFVSADMIMDLGGIYDYNYIEECMDALADKYYGPVTRAI
jgi:hypothetical protein